VHYCGYNNINNCTSVQYSLDGTTQTLRSALWLYLYIIYIAYIIWAILNNSHSWCFCCDFNSLKFVYIGREPLIVIITQCILQFKWDKTKHTLFYYHPIAIKDYIYISFKSNWNLIYILFIYRESLHHI